MLGLGGERSSAVAENEEGSVVASIGIGSCHREMTSERRIERPLQQTRLLVVFLVKRIDV